MVLKKQVKRMARFVKGKLPKPMPLHKIRYEFGFGFGNLYHPYMEVLKERSASRAVDLLEHFYMQMSAYLRELPTGERLSVQAWKSDDDYVAKGMKQYLASKQFEPSIHPHEWRGVAEKKVRHLQELRDSIETHGYDPEMAGSGMRGPLLDNQWVLILGGQNRAVVLAALNWQHIPVVTTSHRENIPRRITVNRVKDLPLVRRGIISQTTARNVLQRICDGFSVDKARALGFPFCDST